MEKLIAAAVVSVALLVGGCSGGGYGTVGTANLTGFNGNPGGSTPPTQPSASTALFHPLSGILPYPTDLYFVGSTDGTLNIQPANALMPNQAAVNALDGFSTTAVIRERFGGALNPASFTAASVIIVRRRESEPRFSRSSRYTRCCRAPASPTACFSGRTAPPAPATSCS
jgi:hypothetical protein